jgi:hypothetical protein
MAMAVGIQPKKRLSEVRYEATRNFAEILQSNEVVACGLSMQHDQCHGLRFPGQSREFLHTHIQQRNGDHRLLHCVSRTVIVSSNSIGKFDVGWSQILEAFNK